MKDYCKDPLCGWYLEVDKDGYCQQHNRADMTKRIQDAFGSGLKDVTKETQKIWQCRLSQQEEKKLKQIVDEQVAMAKAQQRTGLKTRLKYWILVPVVLSVGVFYALLWIGVLFR